MLIKMKVCLKLSCISLLWFYVRSIRGDSEMQLHGEEEIKKWTNNNYQHFLSLQSGSDEIEFRLLNMASDALKNTVTQVKPTKKNKVEKQVLNDYVSRFGPESFEDNLQDTMDLNSDSDNFRLKRSPTDSNLPLDLPQVIEPKNTPKKIILKAKVKEITENAKILQVVKSQAKRMKRQIAAPNANPLNSNWQPMQIPVQPNQASPAGLAAPISQNTNGTSNLWPSAPVAISGASPNVQTTQAPFGQIPGIQNSVAPAVSTNPNQSPNGWVPSSPTIPPALPPSSNWLPTSPTNPPTPPQNNWLPSSPTIPPTVAAPPANNWFPQSPTNPPAPTSNNNYMQPEISSAIMSQMLPATTTQAPPTTTTVNVLAGVSNSFAQFVSTASPTTTVAPSIVTTAAPPLPVTSGSNWWPQDNSALASTAATTSTMQAAHMGNNEGNTGNNNPNIYVTTMQSPSNDQLFGNPSAYNNNNNNNQVVTESNQGVAETTSVSPIQSSTAANVKPTKRTGVLRRKKKLRRTKNPHAEIIDLCEESDVNKNSTSPPKRLRKRLRKVGKGTAKRAAVVSKNKKGNELTRLPKKPLCIKRTNSQENSTTTTTDATVQEPNAEKDDKPKKDKNGVARNNKGTVRNVRGQAKNTRRVQNNSSNRKNKVPVDGRESDNVKRNEGALGARRKQNVGNGKRISSSEEENAEDIQKTDKKASKNGAK